METTTKKHSILKLITVFALSLTSFSGGGLSLIAEVNSPTDEPIQTAEASEQTNLEIEETNLEAPNEETEQPNEQVVEESTVVDSVAEESVESVSTTFERTPRLSNDVANVATEAELIAEINDIPNTPGATKTIIITTDITLTNTIALNMAHGKNVTIQGDNKLVTLTAAPGRKHITLSGTAATTLTFDNINFQGLIEDSRFTNGDMDIINVVNAPNAGGVTGVYGTGTIVVKNSAFTRNKSARYTAYASAFKVNAAKAIFENVSFISNFSGEGGAAILINGGDGENTEIVINNSSFIGNGVNGSGIAGGAVFIKAGSAPVTITNSVFEGNQLKSGNSATSTPSGGGAVGVTVGTRSVFVDNSYFNNNKILAPNEGTGTTADGGALYVNGVSGKVELQNSTFTNNVAHDEGGAVSFVTITNTANRVANNTFVGNTANGGQTTRDGSDGGGAIEFNGSFSGLAHVTFEHNTVYGNTVLQGTATANNGGGVSYYLTNAISNNNIISGNEAPSAATGSTNVYFYTMFGATTITDTGSVVDASVEEIFGVANPVLHDLGNNIVGAEGNKRTILTLPIKPEGLADDKVTATVTVDQNRNPRDAAATLADAGAVEVKWVKYIANLATSNWTLPQLAVNNGVLFYETINPDTVYLMHPYGTAAVTTYVKPIEPTDMTFIHWNKAIDGSGVAYNANTNVQLDLSTNHTVYGIWQRVATLTVTYDANGGTGTVPVDANLYDPNDQVTVLGQGAITRTGYTFMGWTLLADGSGQMYNANDLFVITGNTVLFAKWQLNATPIPTIKPEVKPTPNPGRTCQDDGYPNGYYWNGANCVLPEAYKVPNTGVVDSAA